MLAIRRDREKKALMVTGMPLRLRPRSRSLSSATQKSLNRKHTPSNAPSYRGRGDGTASSSSSRPSSASTALPRTSPSSFSSSVPSRRSPSSSLSSVSAQSNGTCAIRPNQSNCTATHFLQYSPFRSFTIMIIFIFLLSIIYRNIPCKEAAAGERPEAMALLIYCSISWICIYPSIFFFFFFYLFYFASRKSFSPVGRYVRVWVIQLFIHTYTPSRYSRDVEKWL